jgi:hypothetical protein
MARESAMPVSIGRSVGRMAQGITETSRGKRKKRRKGEKVSNTRQHNGHTALCSRVEVVCLCLANSVAKRERIRKLDEGIEMVCDCSGIDLCNRLVRVLGEKNGRS